MQNVRLDKSQARMENAGRNINNLRYTDDTTLMAEIEEGLKSLLMKVKKESGKAGLKLNIQKMKIMASRPISSVQLFSHVRLCDPMNHRTPSLPVHYQLPESTQTHAHWVSDAVWSHHFMAHRWGNSDRLYFLGLQNQWRWWLQPWN